MSYIKLPREAWAIINPDGYLSDSSALPQYCRIIPDRYDMNEDIALGTVFAFWQRKKRLGWRAVKITINLVNGL